MTGTTVPMHGVNNELAVGARDEGALSLADVLASVARVRIALDAIAWARTLLIAVGAAGAAWAVMQVGLRAEIARSTPIAAVVVALAAMIAGVSRWRTGRIDSIRAALWMEERQPAGFALVTLVEQAEAAAPTDNETSVPFGGGTTPRLLRALATTTAECGGFGWRLRGALWRAASRQVRGPALFAVGLTLLSAGVSQVWSRAAVTSRSENSRSVDASRPMIIGAWRVRVVPPYYTGRAATDHGDASTVQVLSGSRLEIVGAGAMPEIRVETLARVDLPASPGMSSTAVMRSVGDGWQASAATDAAPTALRVTRGAASRLLLVDGYADTLPRVDLRLPFRDSVWRSATGTLPLEALLHDDIGLASAAFELIVSTGEGEQFTARTARVAATRYTRARDAALRASLNLDSMQLRPGDIIHLRAVARDGHPAAAREVGTSETRSFRVARASEYDSVAVEAAPPAEFDTSLVSQRMLLLLTEKLESRRPRIGRPVLMRESGTLARDQGRLRLAVGDIVFQRLGGESNAEHAHGSDETGPPTGKVDVGMLEEGDDSPVIAINRPLLEAYNAMWDAGRALEQGDTRSAIPHMRIALAAIERSRAASRLYLRGKPPAVIVDVARVRLAGRDTGITNVRTPRSRLPTISAAREARLLAAASIAGADPTVARDSLAVLRLESMADAPDFVRALDALLAHLARGGDLTDAFARARRALGGLQRIPSGDWSRAGPP